ncbi:MAG: glycosyltransferase family 4 protein [Anaerolineaceae bacterium]
MKNKRLLILPRYTEKGPSSRVRMFRYLPYLKEAGFDITIHPFFDDGYIDSLYSHRPIKIPAVLYSYWDRFWISLHTQKYDLIWLQQELLPWVPFGMEKILYSKRIPLLVDYDDAVFHRYDYHRNSFIRLLLSKKIDRVMKIASGLTVGNDYLADRAEQAGARNIHILPSVVDTKKYYCKPKAAHADFIIGWLGTPKTVHFLETIKPALEKVLNNTTQLVIVGADIPDSLRNLPIQSQRWNEDTEIDQILQFDVGIMPLTDAPFERGKCGYKLIQYMACGLPVIASPVGVNQCIVEQGIDGFLASTTDEWMNAIIKLKNNTDLRQKMGMAGRKKMELRYSLECTANQLVNLCDQTITENVLRLH